MCQPIGVQTVCSAGTRGGRHDGQGELKQSACIEQKCRGGSDGAAGVAGLRKIPVGQRCEEALGPGRMGACRGRVNLLHVAPHAPAVLEHGYHEPRHALVRDVEDMLGVVQERDGVVIAAEQQDPAVQLDEALDRRTAAVGVVPRLP